MSYDTSDFVRVSNLKVFAEQVNNKITTVNENADKGFKALEVVDNVVYFYNSTDTTTTPVASFSFPEEIFLDQAKTTIVENFSFSTSIYPGAVNPNLDGKPVLVLAIKGDNAINPTLKYSFLSLDKLLKAYSAGDESITLDDYTIKVKISEEAGNALVLKNDGLYVDISGKMNKATGTTAGHIATFDSNGNVIDSGAKLATDAEVTEMLNEIFSSV